MAAERNSLDVVKMLIDEFCADIAVKTSQGRTALNIAQERLTRYEQRQSEPDRLFNYEEDIVKCKAMIQYLKAKG